MISIESYPWQVFFLSCDCLSFSFSLFSYKFINMEKKDESTVEGVVDRSTDSDLSIEITMDADRALLRKIDWRLMPVVSLNC